jgi:hypothetical protein
MIIQISMVRNELTLIKQLLPIWKKYVDGFVFLVDKTTDGTIEFLNSVKEEYNILEILESKETEKLVIETDLRQKLFDTGLKYSNKIICLDGDEYLDGEISKFELENILENNKNTLFLLNWIQYTSSDTIRIDGPWAYNLKDRIGCYSHNHRFVTAQNHSQHLPHTQKQLILPQNLLFIAHLQWINKKFVAIKQYYWKVFDYVNREKFNIGIVGNTAYDISVNNFNWVETKFNYKVKIDTNVFDEMCCISNYRLDYIKNKTVEFNIPNLGDWGFDIINL